MAGAPRTDYYLFGSPIQHSTSPTLHNTIFSELSLPNRYSLCETSDANSSELLERIRSPTFGGAAVTMPLKVAVMQHIDKLGPEVDVIGSVNTIVVDSVVDGRSVLLGRNTDYLGIRNALLDSLPASSRAGISPFGAARAGFIIGGGGTTRAAIYPLSELGLSPIFLINRSSAETEQIIKSFPQYDLRLLRSVDQMSDEWVEKVTVGVGAIPSFEPVTDGEKEVYAIARRIFGAQESRGVFLEMCYKPRRTLLFAIAEEGGWTSIEGTEALIEQGFAQSRAWLIDSVASPWNGERTELGLEVEEKARAAVRSRGDAKPVATKL